MFEDHVDADVLSVGRIFGIQYTNAIGGPTITLHSPSGRLQFLKLLEFPRCVLTYNERACHMQAVINPRCVRLSVRGRELTYNDAMVEFGEDGDMTWIETTRAIFDNASFKLDGDATVSATGTVLLTNVKIYCIEINTDCIGDRIKRWIS